MHATQERARDCTPATVAPGGTRPCSCCCPGVSQLYAVPGPGAQRHGGIWGAPVCCHGPHRTRAPEVGAWQKAQQQARKRRMPRSKACDAQCKTTAARGCSVRHCALLPPLALNSATAAGHLVAKLGKDICLEVGKRERTTPVMEALNSDQFSNVSV